jgi:hypothetical protein
MIKIGVKVKCDKYLRMEEVVGLNAETSFKLLINYFCSSFQTHQ